MSHNGFAKRPLIGCTTYHHDFELGGRPRDLVALTHTYIRAVKNVGGIPILIPSGLEQADLYAIFERLDGVLIPGGGDIDPIVYQGQMHETVYGIDKERDETELFLVRQAMQAQKPLFAICRGVQVMNVALGGTLWEDVASLMPSGGRHSFSGEFPGNHIAHSVMVESGSCLARFLGAGAAGVNSLHHQGLKKLGEGLVGTAVSPDGLIEAIEAPAHPFALGVQWHPEILVNDDPAMQAIFQGFVEASALASQRQPA